MKEKPNVAVVDDTEELTKWRGLSQSGMDICCKVLAERMEEEVLARIRSRKEKERPSVIEGAPLSGGGCTKTTNTEQESGEKIAGQESSPCSESTTLQRLQSKQEESTEGEETKQQQRRKIMTDLTRKIRSEGRMDAESRWRVSDLLAADCEKALIHSGWKILCRDGIEWPEEMKKRDEKGNMEEMHQMIEKCGRQCPGFCTRSRSPQHGEEEHRS